MGPVPPRGGREGRPIVPEPDASQACSETAESFQGFLGNSEDRSEPIERGIQFAGQACGFVEAPDRGLVESEGEGRAPKLGFVHLLPAIKQLECIRQVLRGYPESLDDLGDGPPMTEPDLHLIGAETEAFKGQDRRRDHLDIGIVTLDPEDVHVPLDVLPEAATLGAFRPEEIRHREPLGGNRE